MSLSPLRGAGLRCLLSATLAAICLAAPWSPGEAARARYRPRPGSSSPIVTITSSAAGPRAVEKRMARFILSLQANDRAAAARLLSWRVTRSQRQAFLRGRWLTRDSTRDFALVYFLPAIRLRTRGITGTRALVRVEPLIPYAPREMAIGFIDVPMYRERGQWQVQPAAVVAQRRRKPAPRRATR